MAPPTPGRIVPPPTPGRIIEEADDAEDDADGSALESSMPVLVSAPPSMPGSEAGDPCVDDFPTTMMLPTTHSSSCLPLLRWMVARVTPRSFACMMASAAPRGISWMRGRMLRRSLAWMRALVTSVTLLVRCWLGRVVQMQLMLANRTNQETQQKDNQTKSTKAKEQKGDGALTAAALLVVPPTGDATGPVVQPTGDDVRTAVVPPTGDDGVKPAARLLEKSLWIPGSRIHMCL